MSVTRRDLLTLLLGAPLAAEACERREPRPVAGEVRGASVNLGHRLRDAKLEQATGKPVKLKVAIVGGGPSGLSAAWRLSRLGENDYRVFDLESQAGGTSTYGTDGVVPYPWGAHYVPCPRPENRALVALLKELNAVELGKGGAITARERLAIREPEERVFIDGSWHEGLFPFHGASAEDRGELRRFEREVDSWVRFRDAKGRRAFDVPAERCSDDAKVAALDKLSAARWLADRKFKSQRVRWYLEYACRDDYGLDLEHTSAWALLFYFAARVPAPGAESAEFIAWPEGNGHLVRHLMGVAGKRVELGQLVTDVVPGEESVELSVLDAKHRRLRRFSADYVILALPKFVVPRILRPYRDAKSNPLSEFSYGVWLVANLHLRQKPESPGFQQAWDNVIYDSPSLGYVVATHQTLRDRGPSVWTYYRPFTDADPNEARKKLLALDHKSIVDGVVADLGRAHDGLEECLERVDAWRWGHAMVRPVPGLRFGAARKNAARPLGRVYFAHADLSGLALFEEAQDYGIRAAEAILRRAGREFEPLVTPASES